MSTIKMFVMFLAMMLSYCEAYKILVLFPMPSKSHGILGDGIVRHLLNDGHEVTYISPYKYKTDSPNFRLIDVSRNIDVIPMDVLNVDKIIKKEIDLGSHELFTGLTIGLYGETIQNENVQKLLNDPKEQFDVVVAEWMFTELPVGSFNELEREVYDNLLAPIVKKRGRQPPLYHELQLNGSLILGNSHVSLGQSIPMPQNYIPIGGYHIDENVESLPDNLKNILDNAKNGVIYFSMGSNLKSRDIPKDIKDSLLKMFGELKQIVLWKLEEDLPNTPKNVYILNWAPQQSILSHANTVLFITHGGLLSTTETIHFGVPTIGIPAFADQFINVIRAVKKGYALRVDLSHTMAGELKSAIEEVTTNPKYAEKAKELSFIYHDRPVSPGKQISHWVKHVIKTRGALHLRSPALNMPFYQKLYLDLLVIIVVIVFALTRLVKCVCCKYCSKNNVDSKKKTN